MRPHEVLGVRPDASPRDISAAFRRYASHHHPDHGGDRTLFQAGVDAYRSLISGPRRPAASGPRADVVFHRRTRAGIPSLLRLARRRLSSSRHPDARRPAARQPLQ